MWASSGNAQRRLVLPASGSHAKGEGKTEAMSQARGSSGPYVLRSCCTSRT
jgi:hypothetical protein